MKSFLKLLLLLNLCFNLPVLASAENIEELILPNGLKIIVKPDHRAPSVVFQIWYKVGSSDEYKGITGISHLLEHLMFLSDNNPLLGENFNHLNDIGSKGSAYTTRDFTFYYHIMGKKHLALAFEVESNRMQHLSPSITEFNIEKKVVWEELHSVKGKEPFLPAYNKLYELAFKNNAYQFPVIGRLEDLENLTLAKTMSWYKNYYTPDNATIIVVGDVEAAEVFKLARHYFLPVHKTKMLNNHNIAKSTNKKTTETRFVMPDNITVGAILLAYKVPSINTSVPRWEAYALELLAGWLETGTITRLTRVLIKDKQVANEITISYSSMREENTLFIIEAIPRQGTSLKQLEKTLVDEIKQIKTELISQDSLQKIKNQMIAVEIFDRDSMYTQAKIIGQAESVGIHWSEDAQYISHIENVTAAQIKKVLKKYFIAENKIIVIQNAHKPNNKDKH